MGTDVKKLRREVEKLQKEKSGSVSVSQVYEEYHSGILPPPAELERYEQLLPGVTERLLTTYENQVKHRIKIEEIVIQGDSKRSSRGQVFSFIIIIFAFLISAVLLLRGKNIEGFVSMIVPLSGLVSSLLISAKQRRKEREQKNKK